MSTRDTAPGTASELRDQMRVEIEKIVCEGGGATVLTAAVMRLVGVALHAYRDEAAEQRQATTEAKAKFETELASLQAFADRLRQKDDDRHAALLTETERLRAKVAEYEQYEADVIRVLNAKSEALGRAEAELAEARGIIEDLNRAHAATGELGATYRAERDQLRQHILDIDAHATPYGDIPDEPGYVGTYLVTAGALHRALGKIGHTAPKCQAEAAVERVRQLAEEMQDRARRMLAGEPEPVASRESVREIYEASVEDDTARRILAALGQPPAEETEIAKEGS